MHRTSDGGASSAIPLNHTQLPYSYFIKGRTFQARPKRTSDLSEINKGWLIKDARGLLTLLTATSDDVLQEGVLRGHKAPPSSRHYYFDTVNFRNVGGVSVDCQQQEAIRARRSVARAQLITFMRLVDAAAPAFFRCDWVSGHESTSAVRQVDGGIDVFGGD